MQQIFDLIEKETERQHKGIELIASENYVSDDVMRAMGSILTNKYAEGYPSKRYYGGCEVVDQIEEIAIDKLKKLYGVEYANVQPHSGSQANAAVYYTCLSPGDTVLGLDLSHGGHLTHGSKVNFSGKNYNVISYEVEKETCIIDYKSVREKAHKHKPKLIIAGASAYSRDIDYSFFREVADEVGAILMADIAHPAGLIATGFLTNAAKHCHIVTSTTHKTLRGPRGGVILMAKDFDNPWGLKNNKNEIQKMSHLLNLAIFPGTQGGPLMNVIAAKAIAFEEALSPEYKKYCSQVIANSRKLAEHFMQKGYNVVSNGTDNHCFLLDLRNKNISGKLAEKTLEKVHITVNKNMVPFDDKSPFTTSGIRIGSPAITTRGFKEKDMESVVTLIDEALINFENTKMLEKIANKVQSSTKEFSLFSKNN